MAKTIKALSIGQIKPASGCVFPRRDITGRRFHRLVAIEFIGRRTANNIAMWKCVCDCGNTTQCAGVDLNRGSVKSCGCLRNQRNSERSTTHGECQHPDYQLWFSMVKRCHNQDADAYSKYGGRGIEVCRKWRESPRAFFDDMGPRPSIFHSIDRLNNDDGYYKENCRWATDVQQANNRRNSVYLTYGGQTMSVAQWAKKLGVSRTTLRERKMRGWDDEKIVATPVRLYGSKVIE